MSNKTKIYKKGDKVFDIRYGWGKVFEDNRNAPYSLKVEFDNYTTYYYTNDGKANRNDIYPTLSFTEYTLEGFSQERPKPNLPFKVGDVVFCKDKFYKWWSLGILAQIDFDNSLCFSVNGYNYEQLATENPLLNPNTKIWTAKDLENYEY